MFGPFYGNEDPFFAGTNQLMRQMDSMMNSMLQDPFQGLMPMPQLLPSPSQPITNSSMVPFGPIGAFSMGNPFGMPSLGQMFQGFNQGGFSSGPVFSSSSVMTMTTGPDGRPQVYQASQTTRSGPGGVREVQRTVSDSRSGVRKMAIGRHIGDRGHVVEKEQNLRTGDAEEREDFINIEEEEAHLFDDEWKRRTRHGQSDGIRHSLTSSNSRGAPTLAIAAGPSHGHDVHRLRHSTHTRGLGSDRHSRKRDVHRTGKSRHETSM